MGRFGRVVGMLSRWGRSATIVWSIFGGVRRGWRWWSRLVGVSMSVGVWWVWIEVEIEGRSAAIRRVSISLVTGAVMVWPLRMEFNLSSVCNLQCIQCNGDLSSSIRLHREGRAPVANPYGDRFFEDLEAFVPHLRWAQFAGGEPILAPESFRVWEMVERLNPSLDCNGDERTQWNRRVRDVTERGPMGFVFSLDAVSKELYESIRVGAEFESVMANVEHLRGVAAGHGTTCSINFCLMAQNYQGFGDVLLFAEERGMRVDVSVVRDPPSASLASLDEARRRAAHEYLLAETGRVLPFLVINADVRRQEEPGGCVGRFALAGWTRPGTSGCSCAQLVRPAQPVRRCPSRCWCSISPGPVPTTTPMPARTWAPLPPVGPVHSFTVDVDDTVVEASAGLGDLLGEPAEALIGPPSADLQLAAMSALGEIESYEVTRPMRTVTTLWSGSTTVWCTSPWSPCGGSTAGRTAPAPCSCQIPTSGRSLSPT